MSSLPHNTTHSPDPDNHLKAIHLENANEQISERQKHIRAYGGKRSWELNKQKEKKHQQQGALETAIAQFCFKSRKHVEGPLKRVGSS